MLKFIKYFLIVVLFNFVCILEAHAAAIDAKTCSQSDVQKAIDSASDGDTVTVPAGTCTWTTTVTFSNKSITLNGAGIDQTIIGADSEIMLLSVTGTGGKTFRIMGFTFDGTNSNTWGLIGINGTSKSFRIDHNKFTNLTTRGVSILNKNSNDSSYGVIDHNIFIAPFKRSVQSISVVGDGDTAWERPLTLGTANAVYVEDNTFDYSYKNDGALDAYGGARYVFRYNAVVGTTVGHHGTDSGRYRSPVSFEIYNNTFSTSFHIARTMIFRGGTGVIYNNTITGNYGSITTANYRDYHAFATWGACDGTNPYDVNDGVTYDSGTHTGSDSVNVLTSSGKNWTPDQWVGYSLHNTTRGKGSVIKANTADTITVALDNYSTPLTWNTGDSFIILRAYPCLDQVGRSGGKLLNYDSPVWPQQALEPLYGWNNTLNGANVGISSVSPHIQENRDFYNIPGSGVGLLSARPSTCTPYEAYFATDKNTLYKCTATDTWMASYTPYKYPHPLTVNNPPRHLRSE